MNEAFVRSVKKYGAIIRHLTLIIMVACILLPFLTTLSVSLKTGPDVYSANLLPRKIHIANYLTVLTTTPLLRAFLNTVGYIIPPVLVGILTSAMAAYALSRLHYKGRDVIFSILFATIMIPSIVTLVPSYVMFANFYKWVGTPLPLIIPGMFGSVLVMFYLRQFMLGLPRELEEAAMIDGMSKGRIFFSIDLPLCKPAFIAQIVLCSTSIYNDLMTPLMYVNTQPKYHTVQLVINGLNNAYASQTELLMAASILAIVPTLIMFIIAQRYFMEGIAVSAIKG